MMPPAKKSPKKPGRRSGAASRRTGGAAQAAVRLLSEAEIRRLAERIFKLSEADETEVQIEVTSDALTRFANNTIHQNVAEQILTISARTVLDRKSTRLNSSHIQKSRMPSSA